MSSALDTAVVPDSAPRSRRGDPPWEVATLFPCQGHWSEADYLALQTNHLIEFSDGELEFLPMPDFVHQSLLVWLCERFNQHVQRLKLGRVLTAGYRVRLKSGQYREPDVLFLDHRRPFNRQYSEGADLVLEIVSPGAENRDRDLNQKRAEYAAAGIPEYWIVDPENGTVTVLSLEQSTYRLHGEFRRGEAATSRLLEGFQLDVGEAFAAAEVA